MELKEVINLIKEYLSCCSNFYEKRTVERFTCGNDENLYKLSFEVLDCIRNILKKRKHSYISFDGSFKMDIDGVFEDVDLLDSTDWTYDVRNVLNEYALEIFSLRNAWKSGKTSESSFRKHEAKCQKLYDQIDDWMKETFNKKSPESLRVELLDLLKFWALRGKMVNTLGDIELAKTSFEDVLENHPEWLE